MALQQHSSLPDKKWIAKQEPDPVLVEAIVKELGAPKEIATLLCMRGIDSPDKVKDFYNPRLHQLYDPFLMKDMEQAVDRIDRAVEAKERVMIFGDYDVDGTTAVSLTYSFFKSYFDYSEFYIPDRYKEGYGISKQGIDHAHNQKISLIIALDCGIRSVELIDYANSLNIDFIICDHHLPGKDIPKAIAVLDPKRPDCEYPFKELSGCGIGFKLCQAYSQKHDIDDRHYMQYLDLLVLSIASDIVPIVDENRVLAHYGLKVINNQPSLGMSKLIQMAINKEDLGIGDLVFYLGPRINAAGRMDDAAFAVKLLTSDDEVLATSYAAKLNQDNDERKIVDQKITAELQEIVERDSSLLNGKSLVFYDQSWHKGVIGIAASRAIELYYRPTIILTKSNGILSGSGRSIAGFDLHEALADCAEHLIQFGGHKYAAGMTMKEEKLADFRKAFEAVAQKKLSAEDLSPRLMYDLELDINHVNDKFLNIIEKMAPFGPGNMSPVFFSSNLRDNGSGKIIGKTAEHLRLNIQREMNTIPAIGFGMADKLEDIKKADSFEACFSIQENIFMGSRSIQLHLKDLRISTYTDNNDA